MNFTNFICLDDEPHMTVEQLIMWLSEHTGKGATVNIDYDGSSSIEVVYDKEIKE